MIEFKDVSFTYQSSEREVGLRGINLIIKEGEVVLLCGNSGCGKTTIIRLINGLIPHYYDGRLEGGIFIKGKNIIDSPLYETAKIVGSVFQNPRTQFFNVDTTGELAFGCENYGMEEDVINQRIDKVVSDMNLEKLVDRNIFHLSGGEKQKIACGSVAVSEPDIFILDEPSSNLDTASIANLRDVIALWKSQGKTIIISEHRLYYLSGFVNRVYYMSDGEIQEEYNGDEFYKLTPRKLDKMGLRMTCMGNLQANNSLPLKEYASISLCDFNFAYPSSPKLLEIDCAVVPRGGVIAVIGHNGAGKSTFARCLCGLEKKCRGVVNFGTEKLKKKKLLSNGYIVMQDVNHQLFTESVFDEVLISRDKKCETNIDEILKSLNLTDLKELHPMSLSGGQKQRVAIASAIASNRDIIVFDEPTSGLDLRHMQEVTLCLKSLAERGKTLFVITHDPELIFSCCTHVLHMEQGQIIENYSMDSEGFTKTLFFFRSEYGPKSKEIEEYVI